MDDEEDLLNTNPLLPKQASKVSFPNGRGFLTSCFRVITESESPIFPIFHLLSLTRFQCNQANKP